MKLIQYASLALCCYSSTAAFGEGWHPEEARQDWGSFALGFASGLAGHELGHYLVATSKGYRVSHTGLSIVYPGAQFTPSDQLQVASAGFQMQWIMSELALRSTGNGQASSPGNFGAGIVCSHLAITYAYLVYLKDHQLGDVAGIAQATGRSRNQIAIALSVPATLDAWRLFGDSVPDWVPGVSLFSKGLGIAWAWQY